ncbi:hybrid sensor histidine kinase/response regulator transcription factor [Bacteroides graminisolvens]
MYKTIWILFIMFCFSNAKAFAVNILHMKNFTEKDGLSQNTIYHIFQDRKGFMWINAAKWINRYDGKEFRTIWSEKDEKQQTGRILQLTEDTGGEIWFKTASGAIRHYNPYRENFENVEVKNNINKITIKTSPPNPTPRLLNGKLIPNARFITDNKGNKWVFNGSGVLWFCGKNNIFKPLVLIPPEVLSLVTVERYSVFHDSRNIIWITTFGNGLFAIDPITGKLNHFTKKNGLPSNDLHCVTEDRSGEIWVGTDYSGIVKISLSNYPVSIYYPASKEKSYRSNAVRIIFQDSDRHYWLGTRDGELIVCDSLLHFISRHRISVGMPYGIAEDTLGNKWVVSRSSHQVVVFPRNNRIIPYTIDLSKNNTYLYPTNISSILCDNAGRMWLTSFREGLFLVKKEKNNIILHHIPMPTFTQNNMRSMTQTSDGFIWICSDFGATVFNPDRVAAGETSFINFHFEPNNNNSLSYNEVKLVFEDSKKRIWLGTQGGGLNLLVRNKNLEKSGFKRYDSRNGLFNEIVQSIEEDRTGMLWIGTENGLAKFEPEKGHFENFFFSEERNGNIFNERSSWKRRDGHLMFGSYNGIYIFDPSKIFYDHYTPPVTLTGLWINGYEIMPNRKKSPLPKSITMTDRIELEYDENSFNLQFAMLNYVNPELNQYSYFLEGYEKGWNPASRNNIATYRNVPPGKYRFKVKGSNSFGVWTNADTVLEIRIFPPWWSSLWALNIYAFMVALAVYASWRIIKRVNKLKMAVEVEKQVGDFKERLFTNVAHEFRTPLTIIRSAVEKIDNESTPQAFRHTIDSLSRSTDRLLLLTDQLLDFHKAHYNRLRLCVSRVEVVGFIHDFFPLFQIIADNKNINFIFIAEVKLYYMFIDVEKWNKIVYNLLSNAFKYTPDNGTIVIELIISLQDDTFELRVSDSGLGIPESKQKELFDRFMQVSYDSKGHGLGLNLTAELVANHKGRITYSESVFGGACFSVLIPLSDTNYYDCEVVEPLFFNKNNIIKKSIEELEFHPNNEDTFRYKVLIIEDEPEIRILLNTELSTYFHVISFDNGEDGLKTAVNDQPDLIICDIMMPGIDGYETTKRLKNNFETSHIPVILLTALTAECNQLKGIEFGADAYITKPFSLKYLLVRINKLIEQRNKLRNKFSHEPGTSRPAVSASNGDDSFLDTMHQEIESNIANSQFEVDHLIKISGISRSVFYQKFKSLTGFTPNEYLRVIRLKKAADLLTHTDMRISDIAYETGFEDPLYFSKSFKIQFGKSPRQYRTD